MYWSRSVQCTGLGVSSVLVKECPVYWSRSVQCTGQGVSSVSYNVSGCCWTGGDNGNHCLRPHLGPQQDCVDR